MDAGRIYGTLRSPDKGQFIIAIDRVSAFLYHFPKPQFQQGDAEGKVTLAHGVSCILGDECWA